MIKPLKSWPKLVDHYKVSLVINEASKGEDSLCDGFLVSTLNRDNSY